MIAQVFLCIVTFGIYVVFWFYESAKELKYAAQDAEAAPGLWTVLLFVPFGIIYSHYQYAKLFEKVSSEKLNKWILFLLWLVFPPAVWFLVQTDLNNLADKQPASA